MFGRNVYIERAYRTRIHEYKRVPITCCTKMYSLIDYKLNILITENIHVWYERPHNKPRAQYVE